MNLSVPRLYFFFWFGMIGAITPFVPLFYRELGMHAGEIGILSSISGVTALLCAPVWAAVADSLRIERKLVSLGMVAFAGLYLFMSQAGSFSVVLVINVLLAALPPIEQNSSEAGSGG